MASNPTRDDFAALLDETLGSAADGGFEGRVVKGTITAIIGANGSGKSTLLNIVGLLDSASSGNYQLLNQEMIVSQPINLII